MKQPNPWYWAVRKAWYVQVNGKQIKLHANEKEANKAYHRLMASEGRVISPRSKQSVADMVEAMIAVVELARYRTKTIHLYESNLGPFAAKFRNRRLEDLSANEIVKFISEYQGKHYKNRTFNEPGRHLMFRYIKTLFRWARDTGLIPINTLASTKNPWISSPRTRGMTEDEYQKIMQDRQFHAKAKEVIEILYYTGARPGEIAKVEARHLDAHKCIIRLLPGEHKTGGRTGLHREIFVPPDLMERLRGYAIARPRGPLLLNRSGKPWSASTIDKWFRRAKKRLGLDRGLVLYMTRHAFVTRHLTNGHSASLVAKLAGHANTDTIQAVYYHPDTDAMLDIVAGKAKGGSSQKPTDMPIA